MYLLPFRQAFYQPERRNVWIEDNDAYSGGKYEFLLPKDLGKPKAAAGVAHRLTCRAEYV